MMVLYWIVVRLAAVFFFFFFFFSIHPFIFISLISLISERHS